MITLKFDGENANKYFEIIYEGFMVGGSIERTKGLTTLRREINILDKFEQASEPYPCGKLLPINEEPCRKLKSSIEEISFDKSEVDLILRYMSLVPWTTGKSTRNALEVYDWLEGIAKDSGK